ncbi:DUF2589 domain-containing protein [Ferrimonas sediminicola]|uniref:DUF2589 domain-containing protein n=1 Tax=Ferrimonas sediminicola TaxID=2569538 RepID=A0A4U1BAY5_9GAMM|nr:DUF2589 domain-containing protein [Ferrimonas sediminicola]TKB47328.1 DUF2589 domain-containing protein [Ferrimonas sediminicola]
MSELVKISDQFQGLPMADLIGGPLGAACDSQVSLARATSDFIDAVGMEADDQGNRQVRMVNFAFSRPEEIVQADGSVKLEKVDYDLQVPFISIVSVPNLQVDNVDVTFNMEVKSSFSQASQEDMKASLDAQTSFSAGLFKIKARVQGSVSSSKSSQRASDNSAKYEVAVSAKQADTPEGLSRVLDILQQSIAPTPTTAVTTS